MVAVRTGWSPPTSEWGMQVGAIRDSAKLTWFGRIRSTNHIWPLIEVYRPVGSTYPLTFLYCTGLDMVTNDPKSGGSKKTSAIDRIQRLEKLERERLEEKERTEERRRQATTGSKPSGGRHDLGDRMGGVTRFPMTLLGAAALIGAIIVFSTDVNRSASTILVSTLFVLWVVMLVEYLV